MSYPCLHGHAGDAAVIGRAIGCMLGLACCDSLGAAVEFSAPGSFPLVHRDTFQTKKGTVKSCDQPSAIGVRVPYMWEDYPNPHRLRPGFFTDDTSMALCLAASLLIKGVDVNDQLRRYKMWFKDGLVVTYGYLLIPLRTTQTSVGT
jgi:ADP-ribosyl-[dinitrogen reductase] hydrolase